MAPTNDELVASIRGLDMKTTIDTFLASHNTNLVLSINSLVSAIQVDKLEQFIKELIDTITDSAFRQKILHALEEHVKNYPLQTALFTSGVVLLANPLTVVGFGGMGPVAGSMATAWQASIGNVPAGHAFAILQRWGMMYSVPLMITGGVLIGVAAIGYAAQQPAVQETVGHVDKWAKGDYGTPVGDALAHIGGEMDKWGKGEYGTPVADAMGHAGNEIGKWASGDYGNPVSDAANHAVGQAAQWFRGLGW